MLNVGLRNSGNKVNKCNWMVELFHAEVIFAFLVNPNYADCFFAKNKDSKSGSIRQLDNFNSNDVINLFIDNQLSRTSDQVQDDFVG